MKHHLYIAATLARLLDNQFNIGRFRFGLDPIIGLVPGVGDVISLIFSGYLIWIAYKIKVPQKAINTMIKNLIIDLIIGIIPFFGEIGDFWYKANEKNWAILQKYSKERGNSRVEDAEIVND